MQVAGVAADSLGARRIGASNWQVLRAANAEPVTVSDDAIRGAQHRLWKELQLVAEPGGAAAAAALWAGAIDVVAGELVAVIVSGANCHPATVVAG